MGKSTKNLKSALQSQQSRLKQKEKVAHASQVAEHQNCKKRLQTGTSSKSTPLADIKGKGRANIAHPPRRPTIPFTSTDRILLIGEGNFSFARSLIEECPPELSGLPPTNITATAYDSEEECYLKYPDAEAIVSSLRAKSVEVIFGVDGTRLEKHFALKRRKWDRIVWNFPHAGRGISDQDRNILSNQTLILGFLQSASKMLVQGSVPKFNSPKNKKKEDEEDEAEIENEDVVESAMRLMKEYTRPATRGTVLITLRNVAPYTQWDVPRLAKKPPAPTGSNVANPAYILLRSFQFQRSAWKGYEHRMTKGERAHGKGTTGEGGEDRTWEFCLR